MTSYQLNQREYYRRAMAARGTGAGLFAACWRQYTSYLSQGAIDSPSSDDDVLDWLDHLAAERVNDSRSRFYIYG